MHHVPGYVPVIPSKWLVIDSATLYMCCLSQILKTRRDSFDCLQVAWGLEMRRALPMPLETNRKLCASWWYVAGYMSHAMQQQTWEQGLLYSYPIVWSSMGKQLHATGTYSAWASMPSLILLETTCPRRATYIYHCDWPGTDKRFKCFARRLTWL